MGNPNHSSKRGHWKPKVQMLKELIHWTAKGPEGGVPGQWAQQQEEAFHKWLGCLEPQMQGVFFTRNGKVWGVIGPQFDSPESVEEDSEFSAELSNQRQLHRVIAAKVSLSSNTSGKSSFNPLWIEKAKQAILKWEEKAAWEPEIGFIKEQNAYGVIPPKDGRPKKWMQRAKVVFDEYQLKRESEERRSREAESQKQQAKRKDEDDGKGYLSPNGIRSSTRSEPAKTHEWHVSSWIAASSDLAWMRICKE